MGAFTKLFQRLRLTADANVTTQTTTVIQTDTTNSSIALVPNGTGAIIASVPDGTATGGNARGSYAVDLQLYRSINNQVASGLGSVAIGLNTRSSGLYSVALGNGNISAALHSTVTGGTLNDATSDYTTISGGREHRASSNYSTVSGGQSNTASTNTHATVVGGQSNTSSGQHSVSGGNSSVASSVGSVALGQSNTASANRSVALGSFNLAEVSQTTAIGYFSYGYLQGQKSLANGRFASTGDAQQSLLTARKSDTLTTAATTTLSLDGTGTTNLMIPNGTNRAWNVQIDTIAVVTTITGTATGVSVGDCYMEKACLLFKRIGGTSSIVGSPDVTSIKSDASMATAGIDINAGSSQQLEIVFNAPSFSGGGSVTFRIVSKVSLVEVAY